MGRVVQRAFSLIEVMIVLAVLMLVTALVMPALHGTSESVEFKETCEQLSSAVSVCRSEAQRRGAPMEIVTRKESDGRVALVSRPATLNPTATVTLPKGGQVLLVLPHGYCIDRDSGAASTTEPEHPSGSAGDESDGSEVPAPPSETEDDGTPKPLVVFWASGGASAGSGLYLHGRGGRVVGAEINSFTGLLKLEQVADGSEDKGRQDIKQDGRSNQGKPEAPLSVDPNGP
jgi:prepilin-type N-terminal cleavage/methylation domain-containing protein